MENKDPQGLQSLDGDDNVRPAPDEVLYQPPASNALSLEPNDSQVLISQEQPQSKVRRFLRFARRLDVLLAVLLLVAGAVVLFNAFNRKENSLQSSPSAANRFGTVRIPLDELISGKDLALGQAANVTINGSMQLNNSLTLSPSLQPTGAKPGQIYYDQSTNQLAYFNGEVFVFLTSPDVTGVQSLGGATGQIALGAGLTTSNGQLANSGVLSVQGQSGAVTLTAGPGIVINGTNFSNSGVLSVASGSPNVTVTNADGAVTISVTSGAGTITSSGGTVGHIPLFTAAQNIEDSIITQSGMTVTITGDLSVVTGGLSLSNALTVSNGGTGATSFANNGVLVGQGTGAFAAVAAGGPGLCLMSTGGLPTWGACPGSSGVTTLNGLSGALSIANASGAGNTITIDDASNVAKGIASFNATNFTVTSGAVNTVQNINTGATPTFAGVNTNSITPSAGLTVGATSQTLTLQGNATTTLTATNGANTTALSFVTPTANVTYRLQTASAGTYDICTSAGNCTSGGVTSPGGTTNRLAKFTGAQVIGDSIITDTGSNVDIGGTLSVQGNSTLTGDIAVNGGDITSSGVLNITPGGTLTVGVTGQQLTLQGNAASSFSATNAGSATTLTFQTPTANVTYRFPTAAAGTYDICTTAGNCVGAGGGVTTSGGTTNRLAKFTGSQAINDSTITDDGTNVTTSVDLIIQGGDVTVGVANSQTGSIKLAHSGSAFVGTILQGALTANRTYTLPDADGTICLTSGNCSGAGSPNTLQAAYDAGNTITTTTARDIAFTLADSATDANFTVTAATGSTSYVGIVRADGGGTADPAQLLLVENLDTDRAQPVGIKLQSAGGGMTTAIDASDAEIVTAISIGANDILGTTGNIDLSNFDVVGATGNITTSGTLNGQTISSAASFTGTVGVAGNVTLTSDLAVNGGDITSSGVLNITPGGTLTVGATGQQLVLQGSANTQLTATGGGFTTTVGFTGTPTGAVNYNFDRAAAAGTYTICTTIGNCAGTGGGVTTPGGTTGTIAKFTGSQTLGDSLLSESGGVVTVNGNLNLTAGNQYRVNGTQISSADLSNDSNLAKLSASQTFTGNSVAFRNGTNSSNAFSIQNAAGNPIVTVDSSSALLVLGTASTLDGKLVFNNVLNANAVTILPGTPTANRTLTLPDASGIICTDSGNCAGAGATLQTAYNFSVGGTTPKIKVNSSLGGVDIQDADTPIAANLLNIRASNGAGLGSVLFGVGNTGAVTLQNSSNSTTALRLLTAGGTSVLTGDTTNGQILLGQSNTLTGTIVFRNASNTNTITLTSATPTSDRTINLPDASGTICLTSGNCSGSGSSNTLQAAYDAGNTITTTTARDISFTLADTATDSNFLVDLQCDTTCGANGRFAIQDDGTDVFTVLPAGGGALFRNSADSTTAFRVQNAAGTVSVLTLDTTNILTRISGAGSDATATSGTGAVQIGNDNSLNLAFDDNEIIARNNGSTSTLFLQGGGGGLNVGANLVTFQNATNGNNVFTVNNASGVAVVTVDTTDGELELGTASTLTGTLLFRNATNNFVTTLSPTTPTAHRTINLPDASGTVCLQSSSSCGFVTGTPSNYIQNTTTVQTNASIAIQSAADANVTALLKQRATQSADLLRVVDSSDGLIFNIDTFGNSTLTGNMTINEYLGVGVANDSGIALNVSSDLSNTQIGLKVSSVTSGQTADVAQFLGPDSRSMNYAPSGTLTIKAGSTQTASLIEIQSAAGGVFGSLTAGGQLTLGRIAASGTVGAGSLVLADGTTSNFGATLNTTTLTANRTITLPDASGTVCLQGAAACGFLTGSATDYIQNQNSSSQTANWRITGTGRADTALQAPLFDTPSAGTLAIGTTNATAINLQQNTTLASGRSLTLQGAFTMTPSADTTSIFNVRTSASNNMFTIDTQNARVGIGLGSSNVPTLSNAGVEIKGAIRLSGADGTYSDVYTTPLGGGVNTMINIANFDPGASAQLVAMGLPSTAHANSRALSLFDARSGAHQPTLAVLSPNQQQIAGFSWEGSNAGTNGIDSIFYTKTSSNKMNLQANTVDIMQLVNASGVAQAGVGGAPRSDFDLGRDGAVLTIGGVSTGGRISFGSNSIANSIDFGSSALNVYTSQANGFRIFVDSDTDTSTPEVIIDDNGAATFRNRANSSAAFRVLNASNLSLFTIDTSANRAYIGDPIADTTGALLVLDTKTSAGDPAGVDGGMYYNSSYGRMRCYFDGMWRFCNDPVGLTWGYNFEEDFIGGGNDAGTHNWNQAISGSGTVVQNVGPDSGNRPGQIRMSLGTTSTGTNFSSIYLNGNASEQLMLGNIDGTKIEIEFAANIPTLADATNDYNIHMGLCDDIPSASCVNGIYFEYDRDQSVNWRYGAANANSRTLTNSSTAVAAGWHRFKMVYTYSSTGPTATIDYYVDGTLIGTHTNTNVPTTNSTQPQFDIMRDANAGTSDRVLIADYFQYRSSFTTPR